MIWTSADNLATLHTGHVLDVLRSLPAEHFHCCVTSPPYWGLRDYGLPPTVWGDGWVGCYGLEESIDRYVAHTVEIMREIRRVLRSDGLVWWNIGCSYSSDGVESDEYVMRDDVSTEDRIYVLEELTRWHRERSVALLAE